MCNVCYIKFIKFKEEIYTKKEIIEKISNDVFEVLAERENVNIQIEADTMVNDYLRNYLEVEKIEATEEEISEMHKAIVEDIIHWWNLTK